MNIQGKKAKVTKTITSVNGALHEEKSYLWSVEKTDIGDVETIWVAFFIWKNQI